MSDPQALLLIAKSATSVTLPPPDLCNLTLNQPYLYSQPNLVASLHNNVYSLNVCKPLAVQNPDSSWSAAYGLLRFNVSSTTTASQPIFLQQISCGSDSTCSVKQCTALTLNWPFPPSQNRCDSQYYIVPTLNQNASTDVTLMASLFIRQLQYHPADTSCSSAPYEYYSTPIFPSCTKLMDGLYAYSAIIGTSSNGSPIVRNYACPDNACNLCHFDNSNPQSSSDQTVDSTCNFHTDTTVQGFAYNTRAMLFTASGSQVQIQGALSTTFPNGTSARSSSVTATGTPAASDASSGANVMIIAVVAGAIVISGLIGILIAFVIVSKRSKQQQQQKSGSPSSNVPAAPLTVDTGPTDSTVVAPLYEQQQRTATTSSSVFDRLSAARRGPTVSDDSGGVTAGSTSLMGQVPSLPSPTTGDLPRPGWYVVIEPYEPRINDELQLAIGNKIRIDSIFTDGWAMGLNQITGHSGYLPFANVLPFRGPVTPDEQRDALPTASGSSSTPSSRGRQDSLPYPL